MRDLLQKLKNLREKHGVRGALRLVARYALGASAARLGARPRVRRACLAALEAEISSGRYERVILRRGSFAYHSPLFQRAQQLALALGRERCLVLYEAAAPYDRTAAAEKLSEGLWLVNLRCRGFAAALTRLLERGALPRYLLVGSPESRLREKTVRAYLERGWTLLYDYIDALSGEIGGGERTPRGVLALYRLAMAEERSLVLASSLTLRRDARENGRAALLVENGVDCAHFFRPGPCPEDAAFRALLRRGRPRLCFYGALASWLDYEALRALAADGRFDVLLIGMKYDGSFERELAGTENVFFLGPRPYETLKDYAARCDVLLIPFQKGAVGDAASPVKLFEYFALGKPVVAGDVAECRRYRSALIAACPADYVRCVERALALAHDRDYLAAERAEALAADWDRRAETLCAALRRREGK